tara:strand:+ start:82 stop:600 length:519 start_codon:yes stop_codon:yes gene_type:complete
MRLNELFSTEDLGGAIAKAAGGVGDALQTMMDIPPTKSQEAIQQLKDEWNKEFAKLVKKDKSVRERYGVELKKWVESNYNIDNIADKIDVKKTVANGKPNEPYITKVFMEIFKKAQAEKKAGATYGGDSSKGTEKGALGTGTDGKTYVWAGNQWVTQDTNAVARRSVTVTPS